MLASAPGKVYKSRMSEYNLTRSNGPEYSHSKGIVRASLVGGLSLAAAVKAFDVLPDNWHPLIRIGLAGNAMALAGLASLAGIYVLEESFGTQEDQSQPQGPVIDMTEQMVPLSLPEDN